MNTRRFVIEVGPEDWSGCPTDQLRDTKTGKILFQDGGEPEDMTLRRNLGPLVDMLNTAAIDIASADAKIMWLLEHYKLMSEDGTFCFPDGEVYRRK